MERWLEHVTEELQLATADKERLDEIVQAIQYMEDKYLIPPDVAAELLAAVEYGDTENADSTDYRDENLSLNFGDE